MSKDYKTFMTHAKKVTRNAANVNSARTMLQGVHHRKNGSLVVTDSHRLYMLKDVYQGEEKLINPVNNQVIKENYPNVDRLLPQNEPTFSSFLDIDEYLKATDIVNTVGKITNTFAVMRYEKNILKCSYQEFVTAEYTVPVAISDGMTFRSRAQYWVDALQMFKKFKYTEVEFSFYGKIRPFTLTSPDERLLTLLLPVRVY